MNMNFMPYGAMNPLAVLDEEEMMQQQDPTLAGAIGNRLQGVGQGLSALTDPQALLMGAIQPGLEGLAALAQDPSKSFNDRLQALMNADEDPERVQARRNARMAQMRAQGQQNFDTGRNFVQLPTGGFVGGANRGIL